MSLRLDDVKKYGKSHQGKNDLVKHLEGKSITMKGAIKAKCYDCMGYYQDGPIDCLVPECPLYPFMSYKVGGPRKAINRAKRTP